MISETTIDLVKKRANIVEIVGEIVSLRRAGRSLLGLCPFHNERTPSFTVNPEREFWHCFGCKESGGAIDFVMRGEGLSFPEAVRTLAERLGIDVDEGTVQDRQEADRERRDREVLYTVNAIAAVFYEGCLWGGRVPIARGAILAHEELDSRGLSVRPDDEGPMAAALAAFRIGYAPAAWHALVQHLEKEGVSIEAGVAAGLLLKRPDGKGYFDRFRHRLMFPVIDHLGRVVAFSGRALPQPDPRYLDAVGFSVIKADGKGPAKYINSPETLVYTKGNALYGLWQGRDAIRTAGEAVIVEGNFDALSLHAREVTNVVAPLGSAFTEEQAKLLRRFTEKAVVVFDGDTAGKKATWKARLPMRAGKLEPRAATLPDKLDPDDFVRKKGPDAFREMVGRGLGLFEHLLKTLLADGEDNSYAAKNRRKDAAIQLIGEEADPAMARSYADRLASMTVVDGYAPRDLRDLETRINRAIRKQQRAEAGEGGRAEVVPIEDPIAFAILCAVLDVPSVAHRPEAAAVLAAAEGELVLALVAAAAPSAEEVLDGTPDVLRPHVGQRLASPVFATEEDALASLLANGVRLRERAPRANEEDVRREIIAAESAGNVAEVDRLLGVLSSLVSARQSG